MEKSRVLQEALHVLAQEHHQLEKSVGASHGSPQRMYAENDGEDSDEFYDCDTDEKGQCSVPAKDIFIDHTVKNVSKIIYPLLATRF